MMRPAVSILLIALLLCACANDKPTVVVSDTPQLTDEQAAAMIPGSELLAADTNTARTAAMLVATLPPVSDHRMTVEVALHAAMFKAAYESNVGDFTRHFLLEPAIDRTGFTLAMPEREFRIRVLAALADLNTPMAWANPRLQRHSRDGNLFPGTNSLATRLQITIDRRETDQATVIGEIADWTLDIGASRQGITATWNGETWDLQRDPVRLFW